MVKLQAAAGYPGYWPALQLLVEIELEVDIQASHLRALNRLQSFCMRQQAMLDYTTAAVNTEREAVWYKPATWVGRWRKGEMIAVCFLSARTLTSSALMHAVGHGKLWPPILVVTQVEQARSPAWADVQSVMLRGGQPCARLVAYCGISGTN